MLQINLWLLVSPPLQPGQPLLLVKGCPVAPVGGGLGTVSQPGDNLGITHVLIMSFFSKLSVKSFPPRLLHHLLLHQVPVLTGVHDHELPEPVVAHGVGRHVLGQEVVLAEVGVVFAVVKTVVVTVCCNQMSQSYETGPSNVI